VPLRGGERGCCLGQVPDPGIQVAAAGVECGVPVAVVTLVALGWAAGAWVPGRLAIPVPVSRCGADPLARMN